MCGPMCGGMGVHDAAWRGVHGAVWEHIEGMMGHHGGGSMGQHEDSLGQSASEFEGHQF